MIEPANLVINAQDSTVRDRTRPADNRDTSYDHKYDFRTLFYDAIPDDNRLILPGPPLLNLTPLLQNGQITLDGVEPETVHTEEKERAQSTILKFPHKIHEGATFTLRHESITPIQSVIDDSYNEYFSGFNVLMTMQKDEELEWITDWARFYARIHDVNAILLFDNGSRKYSLEQLREALTTVTEIHRIAIVKWPFPYGPQGGKWDGRQASWDSDFCQIGAFQTARHKFLHMSNGVINADIDELVIPLNQTTLFDALADSKNGMVGYGGHWIENSKIGNGGMQLPRFWDHFLTRDRDDPCASKWTGRPNIWPKDAHPTAHFVRNIEYLPSPDFYIAHFRALNSGWKSADRLTNVPNTDLLIDMPLTKVLKKAYSDDADVRKDWEPKELSITDMHQYRFQCWIRARIDRLSEDSISWNKRWLWRYSVPVFEAKTDTGQIAFDFHIDDSHVRLAIAARDRNDMDALTAKLEGIEHHLDDLAPKHMGYWISAMPYSSAQDPTWDMAAQHLYHQMVIVYDRLNGGVDPHYQSRETHIETPRRSAQVVSKPLLNLRRES